MIKPFIETHAPINLTWYDPQLDTQIELSGGRQVRLRDANGELKIETLPTHSEWVRIGCSGFDLVKRKAIYAIFEFDCGHGANALEADEIESIAASLSPHADIVRSTGGDGLHVRVRLLEPVDCESRSAYSALCKAVALQIEKETGILFVDKVDKFGSILWLASVNQTDRSFEQIGSREPGIKRLSISYVADEPQKSSSLTVANPSAALEAMARIKPKPTENDSSRRLYALCCTAVEYNLGNEQAIAAIRQYEQFNPFKKAYSDKEILTRLLDAERKIVHRSAKPVVMTNLDPSKQIEAMEKALSQSANVFQRGGKIVRINSSPDAGRCFTFDNQAPKIQPIAQASLIKYLCDAATFEPKLPKSSNVNALHSLGYYPNIPVINGIVTHPILLPDGSIVREPGYNADSGLFLHFSESFPDTMETQEAVEILKDLYVDFPFNSEADSSAMLSFVLTLVSRNCIDGPVPMFVFDGNRPGVGKGLAIDTAAMISQGRRASLFPGQANPEEIRKHIFSSALNGTPLMVFDNVEGKFGSAEIESILTSPRMDGRVLGQSSQTEVDLSLTFALSANGALFSKDMNRRVVRITLDTNEASPELRTNFKHANLLQHIKAHRPTILMAALSIVANYLKAGCPNAKPLGSFDAWSRIVRSAIINAGLVDPHQNTILKAEEESSIQPDVVALHKAWTFDTPVTVADVVALTEKAPQEYSAMTQFLSKAEDKAHYLGCKLRSAAGLMVGNKVLNKLKGRHTRWQKGEARL